MVTGNKFNKELSDHLKLILYLDQHCFSYSIFDNARNCFQKMKHYIIQNNNHNVIRELIETDSNLEKKYQKTLCVIDVNSSTFIPEPLFDSTNINHYLELISNKDKSYECKYVKQQFLDAYSVFKINKNLLALIESKFQPISLKSTASIVVDYALSLRQLKKNQILAQVNSNNFHITLIQDGKFIFYNKFHFETKEDFLYYFMNCIYTLSIPSKNSRILIMSNLNKDDVLFEKLMKYARIEFVERPENFLYENAIIEQDSHKYHNLFSQVICE
tara:strand:+ start:732 stop:1550 length:819 start_codon:yes stop_codon:yes gene_type:complete